MDVSHLTRMRDFYTHIPNITQEVQQLFSKVYLRVLKNHRTDDGNGLTKKTTRRSHKQRMKKTRTYLLNLMDSGMDYPLALNFFVYQWNLMEGAQNNVKHLSFVDQLLCFYRSAGCLDGNNNDSNLQQQHNLLKAQHIQLKKQHEALSNASYATKTRNTRGSKSRFIKPGQHCILLVQNQHFLCFIRAVTENKKRSLQPSSKKQYLHLVRGESSVAKYIQDPVVKFCVGDEIHFDNRNWEIKHISANELELSSLAGGRVSRFPWAQFSRIISTVRRTSQQRVGIPTRKIMNELTSIFEKIVPNTEEETRVAFVLDIMLQYYKQ